MQPDRSTKKTPTNRYPESARKCEARRQVSRSKKVRARRLSTVSLVHCTALWLSGQLTGEETLFLLSGRGVTTGRVAKKIAILGKSLCEDVPPLPDEREPAPERPRSVHTKLGKAFPIAKVSGPPIEIPTERLTLDERGKIVDQMAKNRKICNYRLLEFATRFLRVDAECARQSINRLRRPCTKIGPNKIKRLHSLTCFENFLQIGRDAYASAVSLGFLAAREGDWGLVTLADAEQEFPGILDAVKRLNREGPLGFLINLIRDEDNIFLDVHGLKWGPILTINVKQL